MSGSIEPLVVGIEGGDGDVDDLHFSDGAVAHAGRDENGGHPAHRDEFAVEFHVALAFEDQVDRLPKVLSFSRTEILTTDPTSPRLRRTGGTEFTELRCGNEFLRTDIWQMV